MSARGVFNLDHPVWFGKKLIKRLTPYLNDLKVKTSTGQEQKLTPSKRAFAWYDAHNGGNAADAHRRVYYGILDKESGCITIPDDVKKGKGNTARSSCDGLRISPAGNCKESSFPHCF